MTMRLNFVVENERWRVERNACTDLLDHASLARCHSLLHQNGQIAVMGGQPSWLKDGKKRRQSRKLDLKRVGRMVDQNRMAPVVAVVEGRFGYKL